ncbi:hypothetical protein Scep_000200 [Stephania cephalantha]|uniref:GDSL esterase/lipase n=1 Tax=Stephania cephalantha TaxID=152367 RepID=A0AAP0Q3X1_9MAGN
MSSLLFILALSVFVFPCSSTAVDGPALFMFGDSSLDVGTNNYINTRAKGNNPPYGIDLLAIYQLEGSVMDSTLQIFSIAYGVNFASGGSGILDITGALTLFSLGARKFGIINVGAIGCVPSARVLNDTGGCLTGLNNLSLSFNSAIEPMLQNLSSELIAMKPLGLEELKSECCGGRFNAQQLCTQNSTVCENRHEYFFWDPFHVTEATAAFNAEALYSGTSEFAAPINLKHLDEYY